MLVVLVVLLAAGWAVAPFPPEHQYSFLNPAIDPW
jgi:hypothetical protein